MNAPHPKIRIVIMPPKRASIDALIASMAPSQRLEAADAIAAAMESHEHEASDECECGADITAHVECEGVKGPARAFVQQLIDALREP